MHIPHTGLTQSNGTVCLGQLAQPPLPRPGGPCCVFCDEICALISPLPGPPPWAVALIALRPGLAWASVVCTSGSSGAAGGVRADRALPVLWHREAGCGWEWGGWCGGRSGVALSLRGRSRVGSGDGGWGKKKINKIQSPSPLTPSPYQCLR